jgi:hypothetical protein
VAVRTIKNGENCDRQRAMTMVGLLDGYVCWLSETSLCESTAGALTCVKPNRDDERIVLDSILRARLEGRGGSRAGGGQYGGNLAPGAGANSIRIVSAHICRCTGFGRLTGETGQQSRHAALLPVWRHNHVEATSDHATTWKRRNEPQRANAKPL